MRFIRPKGWLAAACVGLSCVSVAQAQEAAEAGSAQRQAQTNETSDGKPVPASASPSGTMLDTNEAGNPSSALATIPVPSAAVPPPVETTEPAPDSHPIDEIIVTATKRQKSARDIPTTVNAYSGEDLERRGATSLEQIVKLQPGTSKNGNRIVMRGVATSALGSTSGAEEVGRFFDDVALSPPTRSAMADFDPFDLASVELAKGPQGTLFGGAALSGAIRYIPNRPDVSNLAAAVRSGIGIVSDSKDLQTEEAAMVNVGIADSVGLRAVGSWRQQPGVLDDLHSGRKDIDGVDFAQWRVLGRWQPTVDATVDATYLSWQDRQDDLGFTDSPDKYETDILRAPQPSDMKMTLASLRGEYDFPAFSIIGSASLLRSHWGDSVDLGASLGVQDIPLIQLPLPTLVGARQKSYELRMTSSTPSQSSWWLFNEWDYLVGLYYMDSDVSGDSKIEVDIPLNLQLGPDQLALALNAKAKGRIQEKALFFDLTRYLFDRRLEVNLGGRFARGDGDGTGYYDLGGLHVTLPDINLGGTSSGKQNDNRFNPKAALTWHFSKAISLYASAAQGFRYGGVNASPTAGVDIPRFYKPDSLWNYESGLRTEWFDHTLRVDITGYRIDWKDLQLQQISTSEQTFITNVGGARILGAEATTTWALPDLPVLPRGLSLTLSGGYIDSRITEPFDSADGPVPAGTRMPLTPYWQANGSLNWLGTAGSWLLVGAVTTNYSGKRKNQLVNTHTLPAYQMWGFSLQASNASWWGAPEVTLSGTNIFNKAAQNFAFKQRLGSDYLYLLDRPRTVLLSVQLNFE